jgi:uncharacterized protein (DUF736 family)
LNPPLSTEQILHPDRYPDDSPALLDLPDFSEKLGEGWEEIDRNSLGEWYTYLLLAKAYDPSFRINEDQAKLSAEGWGGDQYLVYHNAEIDQEILVYRSDWDTQKDTSEFWEQFVKYGNNRWGQAETSGKDFFQWRTDDQVISFSLQANQVLWVFAADDDLSKKILTSFPDFLLE